MYVLLLFTYYITFNEPHIKNKGVRKYFKFYACLHEAFLLEKVQL